MKKHAGFFALLLAFILMMGGLALADESWYTRSNTHLRDAATTNGKSIMIIKGGQEVSVTGKTGEWSRVKYGGKTGYIRSDLLVQITRSGYLPLEEGNECPQVEALQRRLRELGYFDGKCNGEFGPDTRIAVMEFQKRNGLDADGIAGGQTQKELFDSGARAASGSSSSSSSSSSSASSTSSSSASALKKGDSGSAVTSMQQALRKLGYITFTPDGVYGSGTERAVMSFQQRNGLKADGIAGSATLSKLYGSSAVAASSSAQQQDSTLTVYRKGDTGSGVRALQQNLKALGYISFTPDGVFGKGTEKAVVAFQERNDLTPDGIAGGATLRLLDSDGARAAATVAATATLETATVLKRGDTGSEVTRMQKRLKELGYIAFSADGVFGSGTRNGVIAFQKGNGLTSDGIAGAATLNLLYSSSAKAVSSSSTSGSSGGTSSGPSASNVRLLHFFNEVKPKYKSGTTVTVYDPVSKNSWKLRFMSMGRHADSEPLTAEDTSLMNKAFGNTTTWTPKAVWVKFPDGVWSMATMHNTPHLSGTISGNNFDGHLCVHFLRDMEECKKNDPNYGVQNQNALRAAWKALTGQVVD